MGLFTRVIRSPFLLRRIAADLRGIRLALERQADVAELQAQFAPRKGGQGFRGFSRDRDPQASEASSVSYVDAQEAERAWEKHQELVPLLGRDPTSEELERALRGDIE